MNEYLFELSPIACGLVDLTICAYFFSLVFETIKIAYKVYILATQFACTPNAYATYANMTETRNYAYVSLAL